MLAASSTQVQDEVFDLRPRTLMTAAERRTASRAIRAMQAHQQRRVADLGKPARDRLGFERLRVEVRPIEEEIEALALDVLEREVGLEKFMVVKLHDERGTFSLQVLSVGLSTWNPASPLWQLSGRGIRKDGTLGATEESVGLDVARIERRKLDGTWELLIPRKRASSAS
jgi:hypothetical protein